jgi:hypothetical protein
MHQPYRQLHKNQARINMRVSPEREINAMSGGCQWENLRQSAMV